MPNRYQNIPIEKINGKRAYQTVRYPEIPLNENDITVPPPPAPATYWTVPQPGEPADAVPPPAPTIVNLALVIPEGIQLRIPSDLAGILSSFNLLNS